MLRAIETSVFLGDDSGPVIHRQAGLNRLPAPPCWSERVWDGVLVSPRAGLESYMFYEKGDHRSGIWGLKSKLGYCTVQEAPA